MTAPHNLHHSITSHRDELTKVNRHELHFNDGSSVVFKDLSTALRLARLIEMFEITEDEDGELHYATGRPEEQGQIYEVLSAHLYEFGVRCGRIQPDTDLSPFSAVASTIDSAGADGDQLPAPQCPRDIAG